MSKSVRSRRPKYGRCINLRSFVIRFLDYYDFNYGAKISKNSDTYQTSIGIFIRKI